MAGNAWEKVQDGYFGSYQGAPSDGSAWEDPAVFEHVGRGGSWIFDSGIARSAYRTFGVRDTSYASSRLRPARSLDR
jgi:formylglycine-generating enzyme required for sulfatase activity